MASSQDPNGNPVAINVVPMVDVIFCLCVFFMCSMKWNDMEGKFCAWLPKHRGGNGPEATPLEEVRVALHWDADAQKTVRRFGYVHIRDDGHLRSILRAAHAEHERVGMADEPCIVDGAELVPWHEIVNVINLAKKEGIHRIEFAAGRNYEAK